MKSLRLYAFALITASNAQASPYTFEFALPNWTNTFNGAVFGTSATLRISADNGASSLVNQSYSNAQIQSVLVDTNGAFSHIWGESSARYYSGGGASAVFLTTNAGGTPTLSIPRVAGFAPAVAFDDAAANWQISMSGQGILSVGRSGQSASVMPVDGRGDLVGFSVTGSAAPAVSPFFSARRNNPRFTGFGPSDRGGSTFSFDGTSFRIDTSIALSGEAVSSELLLRWEQGIENTWSYQYDLSSSDGVSAPIVFNVDFVSGSSERDYSVNVGSGSGCRWTAIQWCLDFDASLYADFVVGEAAGRPVHERAAAHEFGHLLGMPDEYTFNPIDLLLQPDLCFSALGARIGTYCDGLMADVLDGQVQERYFTLSGILDFIRGQSGRPGLVLGALPSRFSYEQVPHTGLAVLDGQAAAVPEPGSLALVTLAALCAFGARGPRAVANPLGRRRRVQQLSKI